MQIINEPEVDALISELAQAYKENLIPFYQVGRCLGESSVSYIDVYIGLNSADMRKEDRIKKYIRSKYGSIVRAIAIEQYHY